MMVLSPFSSSRASLSRLLKCAVRKAQGKGSVMIFDIMLNVAHG